MSDLTDTYYHVCHESKKHKDSDIDLVFISVLINMLKTKPTIEILKNVEDLKLKKYEKEIELLSYFNKDTFRYLNRAFQDTIEEFKIKEFKDIVSKNSNADLLDLMGELK